MLHRIGEGGETECCTLMGRRSWRKRRSCADAAAVTAGDAAGALTRGTGSCSCPISFPQKTTRCFGAVV